MKKISWFLALAMVIVMMAPAFAAPLFPDVPENHWARDAVADLAAKGIIEGYPDGTFKGDRAATRWEMAMALQRFLAKMEAEHAKFATKSDLEALRALVNNLKDELDALGVRVKNLEENVSALDKRVTELERITFEGDFVTRFVTVGIANSGRTGTNWNTDVGGINAVDLTQNHKLGTIDLFNGRPLINGSGFTARARLGVKVKVNKDMRAGIRFAAFTSLGDRYIDAYWGVAAPYLSNVFAGNSYGSAQNINNSIWTRMTLDKFWFEHIPTKTKLVAGAVEKTTMDDFILHKVPNPGYDGRDRTHFEDMQKGKKSIVSMWKYWENEDSYLPFYGIQVSGKTHLISDMSWEVMYSKLPDDFSGASRPWAAWAVSQGLFTTGAWDQDLTVPYLFSANIDWKIKDKGNIKLNFMRVSENLNNGQATTVFAGLPSYYDTNGDGTYDTYYVNGRGNPWGWTDPWDRRNDAVNKRPMRSNPTNNLANYVEPYISQQGQTSWGISINYRFDPSNIRVKAAYGGSEYKPNLESGYSKTGSHFEIGVGWTDKNNQVDLDVAYISTDPYYDAFQLYYQPVGDMLQGGLTNASGWFMFPTLSYANFGYQLHDSDLAPNNRQGIRFNGEYRFSNGNGRINLRLGFLQQSEDSAPHRDITGIFNGMKPGFIDPVFMELATTNAGATIPETPKGSQNHYGGGIEYKFSPSPFKASVQYDYYDWRRDSDFADNTAVAMQNEVDLRYQALKIGLAYAFSDKFTLRGGYDWATVSGYHPAFHDPVNQPTATAGSDVIDQYQTMPYLGFDYDIGKNTQWSLDVRYYNTVDELSRNFSNRSKESFNGVQFMTQFKVKF